jgi:DNA helicase-2/ATP-dependent DNA helicase PcrA
MDDHLFDGLTPAQREAVLHVEGPLLVLAGPGSGKTRVITHRIAYLLSQGIPDSQILALTFTNKAAEEMRARVERLAYGQRVWVSTFHRFCARLLRKYARLVGLQENYTIYDADDALRALRHAIAGLKHEAMPVSVESVASAISWAKNNLVSPADYQPRSAQTPGVIIRRAYQAYEEYLTQSNAADFDDLLRHMVTILRDNPEVRADLDQHYRFVLVDEYQDSNLAQYAIVRALSIDHPNLAVTGDPDQSIYGWRGANLHNILEFERDYPAVHVVRLERNYRSTQRILHVADTLIRYNVKRKQKALYTENGEGTPVRLVTYATQNDEATDIAEQIAEQVRQGRRRPRDFVIFYRVNALSRSFELALHERGVPYQIIHGLEFYHRKEIKDVLAYLQLLNNPHDRVALLRVINTPARGIGKAALTRLIEHMNQERSTLLDAARQADRIQGLGKKAAKAILAFVAGVDRWTAASAGPIEELMGLVLSESGYRAGLEKSDDPEDQERLGNIDELLTVARQFDERHGEATGLEAFLEETSLVSDTDDWQEEQDRVSLMTLHASKGLEFPVVYLVAVEQGLLPHERSRHSPDELEEERRLMFVGITRAQQELQISRARFRDFRGRRGESIPSEFLMELPRAEMDVRQPAAMVPDYTYEPAPEEVVWTRPEEPAALPRSIPQLTTAAALAGSAGSAVSPNAFHQGMVVLHPNYGPGLIVALSGAGPHRTATVDFAPPTGRVKFVLAMSPLRPLSPAEG